MSLINSFDLEAAITYPHVYKSIEELVFFVLNDLCSIDN